MLKLLAAAPLLSAARFSKQGQAQGSAPPEERGALSLRLILHGRRVCLARKPRCGECVLADICPSAFKV